MRPRRAEPDGYIIDDTVVAGVLPEADRLFDRPVAYEVSQFAPVARVLTDPTLLAVRRRPGRPCRISSMTPSARRRPGSSGPGTLHRNEMFATSAGIKLLRAVPWRRPALTGAQLHSAGRRRRRDAEAAGR